MSAEVIPLRPSTRFLVCRDPATYRKLQFPLPAGWDENTDPEAMARMILTGISATNQAWRRKFGVALPLHRVEWTLQMMTPTKGTNE